MSITAQIADLAGKVDALTDLVRGLTGTATTGPDPEWTRMPARGTRCPVSNWSRMTIERLIARGTVRSIKRGWSRFYAAADVRRHLNTEPNTP